MKGPNRAGWGKAVGGFALGAAAGSTVALLFAPASGKITRKHLAMSVKSAQRAAGQKILRAKKLLAKKADYLRGTASEKFEDTRDWLAQRMNHRQPAPRRVHS